MYTRAFLTNILARILARKITRRVGQVGEDPRVCSSRGKVNTKLFLWQAERGSRRTRHHPRDDPHAEVGEDVRVGAVECQLYCPLITSAEAGLHLHGSVSKGEALDTARCRWRVSRLLCYKYLQYK